MILGEHLVNTKDNKIQVRGQWIKIDPKLSLLLSHFISNAKKLISKEEIAGILYPNRKIAPSIANHFITQLRKVLEDEAKSPSYIKTHHREGYSLLVQPRPLSEG